MFTKTGLLDAPRLDTRGRRTPLCTPLSGLCQITLRVFILQRFKITTGRWGATFQGSDIIIYWYTSIISFRCVFRLRTLFAWTLSLWLVVVRSDLEWDLVKTANLKSFSGHLETSLLIVNLLLHLSGTKVFGGAVWTSMSKMWTEMYFRKGVVRISDLSGLPHLQKLQPKYSATLVIWLSGMWKRPH